MTKSITQPEPKGLRVDVALSYFDEVDTPFLPETLTLELTADEVTAVDEARAFLDRNPAIHSVNVSCTPPEIETWQYDVSYLIVFRDVGCYLYLQGKYDCTEQVEYSVEI